MAESERGNDAVSELAELAELPLDTVSAVLRANLRLVHNPELLARGERVSEFVASDTNQPLELIDRLIDPGRQIRGPPRASS